MTHKTHINFMGYIEDYSLRMFHSFKILKNIYSVKMYDEHVVVQKANTIPFTAYLQNITSPYIFD